MTNEPEEIIAQAKQVTAQIGNLIEAIAPAGMAKLALAAPIAITAKASHVLDKMAKSGFPLRMAKMHAAGIVPNMCQTRGQGQERQR